MNMFKLEPPRQLYSQFSHNIYILRADLMGFYWYTEILWYELSNNWPLLAAVIYYWLSQSPQKQNYIHID